MDVSSSTATNTNVNTESTAQDPIKKALDVQEQQITKVLEDSQEQAKEVTAQKTGLGNNLNING